MELVRCTAPDHADNWWWGRALGSSRWAGGAECNKKQNTHTTNPRNWLEKTQQQKFTHAGWNKSATTGDMPNVHNEPLRMEHLDTLRSQRRLKCDGNKKNLVPELDFEPNVMTVKDSDSPVLAGCESWFGRLEPRAGRSPRSGGERTRCRWRKWHTIFESWRRADEVDPTWPKSTLTSTPIKWRWQRAMCWGNLVGSASPEQQQLVVV